MFLLKRVIPIQICCESHVFSISKATIGTIANKKGKNRQGLASSDKIILNTYPKEKLSSLNIEKSLKCSVSIINKIINIYMNLKKAK